MIIFRYLSKEIFTVLTAVTGILLLIFLSNQFIRYLSIVADGNLLNSALFKLMAFEVPQLLEIILPLGLFIGILLAFGRLYVDGEMTVLSSCGLTRFDLIKYTMAIAVTVTALIGILTLWVCPHMVFAKKKILAESSASTLATILPGRFQASSDGRRIVYVESMSHDRRRVRHIFVAEKTKTPNANAEDGGEWSVFSAKSGSQYVDKATKDEFVVATNGYRYQGTPGQEDYRIMKFGTYGVLVDERPITLAEETRILTTTKIWQQAKNHDVPAIAELQWRLSLPFSALLLALLAVPLSRVKPRQGKYEQLLPSILIYILYANMLFVGRAWVADGVLSPQIGLWWVHFVLLFFTLLLLSSSDTWRGLFTWMRKPLRRPV